MRDLKCKISIYSETLKHFDACSTYVHIVCSELRVGS